MATTASNDFLRFSAYQIKDLITRKLSEDTNFTDQVYEGSNLAILIDIVSYMYQCLIYNLNSTAAESMFADTQLYENISRLCKFIGYHPTAFKPATINASIDKEPLDADSSGNIQNYKIFPCTAIDTGLYDSNSKKIYFSTVFERSGSSNAIGTNITDENYTNFTLVNGRWKHYSTVFEASGIDYETFVLDGLKSDSKTGQYIANNGIQVFVIPNGINTPDDLPENQSTMWYNDPNEIFIQAFDSSAGSPTFSKLYDNKYTVYTSYLNEKKTFEIKFGNGISGRRLNRGDQIHVMYLDTNGPDGYIDMSQIQSQFSGYVMKHDPNFFGISPELYQFFFGINYDDFDENISKRQVNVRFNPDSLSRTLPEQNVDQIRETAPNWFKTGNRLITKEDYEFFLKANNQPEVFPGVVDVVCMNNWDYMTTFYRWLYNLGINPVREVFESELNTSKDEQSRRTSNAYYYLSKSRLIQSGYMYVDSADANNIYLWIASGDHKDMTTIKNNLNVNINNIKTMTSETYPMYPIDVYFDLSFTPSQLYYDKLVLNDGNCEFDEANSYLEITISDNSIFSNVVIANKVRNIIENAFSPERCMLGQTVNYSGMLNEIYQINGVVRVRTVYYPVDYLDNETTYEKYKTRACDGLAFASFSYTPLVAGTRLIDIGDDLQINNTSRSLQKFQFPRLATGVDISNKIKVIRKSMNSINPVKF